jgi:ParB/RepB/Spo0J family partition protein
MTKQPKFEEVPLNHIHAKSNYRETFDEADLKELAQSIKENGVIEPIIIRPNGKGYAIIAGERRWRAAKMARLATIPSVIRDVTDQEVLKLQLIENVQRKGVPFMEEAYGLQRLRDEHDLDVAEICRMIGKSDAWVYQTLSLTRMHGEAQRLAKNGFLSKPVSILIARLSNPEDQCKAANDLARTQKGKLVDIRFARRYVEEKIEANGKPVMRRIRNSIQKQNGNDYMANWKRYLVNFDHEQFERFKAIVRGRTQTDVLAEAVDLVMRRAEEMGGVEVDALSLEEMDADELSH